MMESPSLSIKTANANAAVHECEIKSGRSHEAHTSDSPSLCPFLVPSQERDFSSENQSRTLHKSPPLSPDYSTPVTLSSENHSKTLQKSPCLSPDYSISMAKVAPSSPPQYTLPSPQYAPSSPPQYTPSSSQYAPSSPQYAPSSPQYAPSSPQYAPSSLQYPQTSKNNNNKDNSNQNKRNDYQLTTPGHDKQRSLPHHQRPLRQIEPKKIWIGNLPRECEEYDVFQLCVLLIEEAKTDQCWNSNSKCDMGSEPGCTHPESVPTLPTPDFGTQGIDGNSNCNSRQGNDLSSLVCASSTTLAQGKIDSGLTEESDFEKSKFKTDWNSVLQTKDTAKPPTSNSSLNLNSNLVPVPLTKSIKKVVLPKERLLPGMQTQKNRGFGFVLFETDQDAIWFQQKLHHYVWKNHTLQTDRAKVKNPPGYRRTQQTQGTSPRHDYVRYTNGSWHGQVDSPRKQLLERDRGGRALNSQSPPLERNHHCDHRHRHDSFAQNHFVKETSYSRHRFKKNQQNTNGGQDSVPHSIHHHDLRRHPIRNHPYKNR